MLSRLAESLYWIGRYVERAENTARFQGGVIVDVEETGGVLGPLDVAANPVQRFG